MRKYSKKGWERRKKEREGYAEFFEFHINKIKKERIRCEECGKELSGQHSEVCHVVPKSYFKSVATEHDNVIYLCHDHHNFYDNNTDEEIQSMKIFPKIQDEFKKLEEKITEKITWKHYNRWQI